MDTGRVEGTGERDAERAGRLAGSPLWLISRDAGGRSNPMPEPLLVDGGRGGEALAVFGHEEEAEMFLGFWAPGDGWGVRGVGARDLASSLRGPSWRACDAWPSTRFRGTSPGRRSTFRPAWTGTGSRSASAAVSGGRGRTPVGTRPQRPRET